MQDNPEGTAQGNAPQTGQSTVGSCTANPQGELVGTGWGRGPGGGGEQLSSRATHNASDSCPGACMWESRGIIIDIVPGIKMMRISSDP